MKSDVIIEISLSAEHAEEVGGLFSCHVVVMACSHSG